MAKMMITSCNRFSLSLSLSIILSLSRLEQQRAHEIKSLSSLIFSYLGT